MSLYSIPEFAARWCGLDGGDLYCVLHTARPVYDTAMGRQILHDEKYPCLEARCRYICNAITENKLTTCNEKGQLQPPGVWIAWHRMRLRGDMAIEWLSETDIPIDELPNFLFRQEEKEQELSARKETSYRMVLYALLKAIGRNPFPKRDGDGRFKLHRDLTGWVKTEVEKNGFSLSDDTIRKILMGLQYVEGKRKSDFD